LRRAMIVARGDPIWLLARPISGGLLALAAIVLAVLVLPSVSRQRETVFQSD
jgi:putative tricarboxylic transport membrane protein